ncbi:hypothetical protein ACMFMG_010339 [Clarireedia jacksonii]
MEHNLGKYRVPEFLANIQRKIGKMATGSKGGPEYVHPGLENDRLFKLSYNHVGGDDCRSCDETEEVERVERDSTDPKIHYGVIASGNWLVRDTATREKIVQDIGKECICFETEATGLMSSFPCLVVRGICDYADSHTNTRWQCYASATAAAYAKELLRYVSTVDLQETQRAREAVMKTPQSQLVIPPASKSYEHFFPEIRVGYIELVSIGRTNFVLLAEEEARQFQAWSEYSILPIGFDPNQPIEKTDILAKVVVDDASPLEGRASFIEMHETRFKEIQKGCPAIHQSLSLKTKFGVKLSAPSDKEMTKFKEHWRKHKQDQTLLQLEDNGDSFFIVALDEIGNFQIQNRHGELVPNVCPPLPSLPSWDAKFSIPKLMRRLEHLAHFNFMRSLENPKPSTLRKLVSFKLLPRPWAKPSEGSSQDERILVNESDYEVEEYSYCKILVKNESSERIQIIMLCFTALFGIQNLFSTKPLFVEPGRSETYTIKMSIPLSLRASAEKGEAIIDTLKLFVFSSGMAFNSIWQYELGDIESLESFGMRSFPRGYTQRNKVWEEFLRQLAPPLPKANSVPDTIRDWQTMDIRIRIMPKQFVSNYQPGSSPKALSAMDQTQRDLLLQPGTPNPDPAKLNLESTVALGQRQAKISILESSDPTSKLCINRESILEVIRPAIVDDNQCKISIEVSWDIFQFYKEELPKGSQLHQLVVLTGTPTSAEASSCEDFVTNRWHDGGRRLLDALVAFIDEGRCDANIYPNTHLAIEVPTPAAPTDNPERTKVHVSGQLDGVLSIIEQIAWFTAILRKGTPNDLTISTTIFRKNLDEKKTFGRSDFELFPKTLALNDTISDATQDDTTSTCWHHLFRGSVLAFGFLISDRNEGKGVEIPFELMVNLANITTTIGLDEGRAILAGHSVMLFPTGLLEDGIQWHCFVARDEAIPDIPSSFKDLENVEIRDLSSRRTFLGCYENARVMLATADLSQNNTVNVSESCNAKSQVEISRDGTFSSGFSIKGILNGNIGGRWALPRTHEVALIENRDYLEVRDTASKRPILVYDTTVKTAWLVSELSVVLHIAFQFFRQDNVQQRRMTGINLATPWPAMPYAEPSVDDGISALDACRNNHDIVLWNKADGQPKKFWSVIEDILKDISTIRKAVRQSSTFLTPFSRGKRPRGWDFLDLVTKEDYVIQKELLSNEDLGWWGLGKEDGMLVIFGSGFGRVIEPVPMSMTTIVPDGAKVLVASMPCVEILRKEWNLGSLAWRQRKNCQSTECPCPQIQKLGTRGETTPSIELLKREAVVFGNRKYYHNAHAALQPIQKPILINICVPSESRLKQHVRLERLYLSDNKLLLVGLVAVVNDTPEKHVSCRYTLDNWGTFSEVEAQYTCKIQKEHDRFMFNIDRPDHANPIMELCLQYNTNGKVYWDNNNTTNFRINIESGILIS